MPKKLNKFAVRVSSIDDSNLTLVANRADNGALHELWQDARYVLKCHLLDLLEQEEEATVKWGKKDSVTITRPWRWEDRTTLRLIVPYLQPPFRERVYKVQAVQTATA